MSGKVSLHPLRIVTGGGGGLSLQEGLTEGVVSLRGVGELLGALEGKSLSRVMEVGMLEVHGGRLVCGDDRVDLEEAVKSKLIHPANIFFWDSQTNCVTSLKAALANDRMRKDGAVYDWLKNEWVSFQEAMDSNLIVANVAREELLARYSCYMTMRDVVDEDLNIKYTHPNNQINNGYDRKDNYDSRGMSLGDVIMDGRFTVSDLKLNVGDGGDGGKLSLLESEKDGFIDEHVVEKIIDVVSRNDLEKMVSRQQIDLDRGRVRSYEGEKWVKMGEGSKLGLVNLDGVFVVDLEDGKVKSLGCLGDEGRLDVRGGMMVVGGRKMKILEAVEKGEIKMAVNPDDFYNPTSNQKISNIGQPSINQSGFNVSNSNQPIHNGEYYDVTSHLNNLSINGLDSFEESGVNHRNNYPKDNYNKNKYDENNDEDNNDDNSDDLHRYKDTDINSPYTNFNNSKNSTLHNHNPKPSNHSPINHSNNHSNNQSNNQSSNNNPPQPSNHLNDSINKDLFDSLDGRPSDQDFVDFEDTAKSNQDENIDEVLIQLFYVCLIETN